MQRVSSTQQGYDYAWQKLRLLVLKEEPTCRVCNASAMSVHHIDGNVRNPARENLEPLCALHHNQRTNWGKAQKNRENGNTVCSEWLERPFQFFHPQPEVPFDLPIEGYELGFAKRPVSSPPSVITRRTIRFHLTKPVPAVLFKAARTSASADTPALYPQTLEANPYIDFTNQFLIEEVVRLMRRRSRPVTLRLTRHGLAINTIYDVEIVK